jgi:V8-like Glu-specific endopeptidase
MLGVASRLQGQPDGAAPYVGLAVFVAPTGQPSHRCSASLLSPTVVLTAGHCTDYTAVARVWFDGNVQNNSEYPFGGATSYESVLYTYPASASGAGTDCRTSPIATSPSSC